MKVKEPELCDDSQSSLAHVLTWYSNERSKDDAKDYLLEYTEKYLPDFISIVRRLSPQNLISTYGWLSRLILRGVEIQHFHTAIKKYVESIVDKKESEEPALRKYTKQEYDIDEFLGSLEEKIDDYMLSKKPFDINQEIKKQGVPSKFHKQIKEWASNKIQDFQNSIVTFEMEEEGTLPEVIEEKIYPDIQRQKLIQFLTIESGKKKQIVRKRKIDPTKQVESVKYCKEYFQFKSVNPVHILESKMCITYNTKYNVIAIFKTNLSSGLFVKGSSVYNFDESLGKKTLKLPFVNLKNFLECPKSDILSLYESIKSKPSKLSGQLNEHTLILRVEQ